MEKFEEFYTHTGRWATLHDQPLPQNVSMEELQQKASKLTFDEVRHWVEFHDNIERRLRFGQAYMALSPLWITVIKPLMSMKTTGSIDVERFAKPLKNVILTKHRDHLSDENAIVLWRAQPMLKNLMDARAVLKGIVHDNLLRHAARCGNNKKVLALLNDGP
ncbi:hypothetical protein ACHAWF_002374 [Thalassiosira exigua]